MEVQKMSKKKKIALGLLQLVVTLLFIAYCFALYNENSTVGLFSSLFPVCFFGTLFFPRLPVLERLFKAKNTTGNTVLNIWTKVNFVLLLVWGVLVFINVIIPMITN